MGRLFKTIKIKWPRCSANHFFILQNEISQTYLVTHNQPKCKINRFRQSCVARNFQSPRSTAQRADAKWGRSFCELFSALLAASAAYFDSRPTALIKIWCDVWTAIDSAANDMQRLGVPKNADRPQWCGWLIFTFAEPNFPSSAELFTSSGDAFRANAFQPFICIAKRFPRHWLLLNWRTWSFLQWQFIA